MVQKEVCLTNMTDADIINLIVCTILQNNNDNNNQNY